MMRDLVNTHSWRRLALALTVIALAVALWPVSAPAAQAQGTSTVSFQEDFVEALEDDGTKEITLTVTPALTTASTVNLRSLPGDLRHNAPDDAYDLPESVDIPAGESAVTFDVTLTDNEVAEGKGQYDRVLAIGLVAPNPAQAPYRLGQKKMHLAIGDDDIAKVSFESNSYEVAEGGSVAVKVKLDRPTSFDLVVYLSTGTDGDEDTDDASPDDYRTYNNTLVRFLNGDLEPHQHVFARTYADNDDDDGEVFQFRITGVFAYSTTATGERSTYKVETTTDRATVKITAPKAPGDNEESKVREPAIDTGTNRIYAQWHPPPVTLSSYELHYTSASEDDAANGAAKISGGNASLGWVDANLPKVSLDYAQTGASSLVQRASWVLGGLAGDTSYRVRVRAVLDVIERENNVRAVVRKGAGKWYFYPADTTRTQQAPAAPSWFDARPGNGRVYLEFPPVGDITGYHIRLRSPEPGGTDLEEDIISIRPTLTTDGTIEGNIRSAPDLLSNGVRYLVSVRSCRIREISPYQSERPIGCGQWTQEKAVTPEGAISTFPTDDRGPVRLHRGPGALLVEWDHFGSTLTYRIQYTTDSEARADASAEHFLETDPAFGWVDTGFVYQDFQGETPNFLIKGLHGGKEHRVRIQSRDTSGQWREVRAFPVVKSEVWIVDEHKEVSIREHWGGFRDIKQVRVAIFPFLEKEIAIRFQAEDGTAREGVDFTILPHYTYIPAFAKSALFTIKSIGEDRVTDGDKTATIRIISEREFYQADPDSDSVALTVIDNSKTQESDDGPPAFWLGREFVTVEEGGSLNYQVGLRGAPTANVSITARVAYDDGNGRARHGISHSPATLTWRTSGGFGGSNEFTLQIRDDNVAQGDVVYYILHHLVSDDANFDSDRQFHSLAEDKAAILKVTVTDNDADQGAPVNRAPALVTPIDDVTGLQVGDTRLIPLSGVFSYAGHGSLIFFARSSDDTVAQVSADLGGASLTVSAESAGTATILVVAEDPDGDRATDEFSVTVTGPEAGQQEKQPQQQQINHAPTLVSAIDDVADLPVGDTRQVSLSGVFDYDGSGALTIAASSSDNDVAQVSAAADGSGLTVSGESEGTATIMVIAEDPDGDRASDEFDVTVTSPKTEEPQPPDGPEPWDIQVVPGDGALTVTWRIGSRDGVEGSEIWHVLRWSQESGVWANPRDPRAVGKNDGLSVDPGLTGYTITGLKNGVATGVFIRSMVGHRNNMSERDGNSSEWVRVKGEHTTPVAPPNDAPTVASPISDATIVNESGTRGIPLSGVFSDADGDALTVTASSSAESVATVSVAADHSTLTVTAKARGAATVTVTSADGKGGSVEDSFAVTVKAAPVVASAIADISGLEPEDSRAISLSGVFSDADGDAVTVTGASSSDSAIAAVSVALDGATSAITGLTVVAKSEGAATITVTAEDSDGNTVSDAFDVSVNAAAAQQQKANSAPTVSAAIADATIVNESGTLQVTLSNVFNDADGDALTVNATSSAEGVATVAVSADYSTLTVTARARGTATVTVTADDGSAAVKDSFTVKVKAAPVVASAIADATMVLLTGTNIDLSKVFSDADEDTLTFAASSTDQDAVAAYEFYGTLTVLAIAEGKETITVTARDSDGNTVSDAFDVSVAGAEAEQQQQQQRQAVELPGAVTDLDLTASAEDSVTVSWSVPETGGAPRGYIVHLRPEGGSEGSGKTKTPGADKTTVSFNNLESGRTYRVWVRAENEAGKGERVRATIALPAALPGPVTGLEATATADGVTVRWSAPETGGAPDGYVVHVRPEDGAAGSGRTKTLKAKRTSVTFENLEAGRTYRVWARAENEAGKGERVHATITLPQPEPPLEDDPPPEQDGGQTSQ